MIKCKLCGSDKVDSKMWVDINTGTINEACDDEEGYCNGCEKHIDINIETEEKEN